MEKIKECIHLMETWLSEPEDNTQLENWIDSANALAYSFEFSDNEQAYIDRIIEMYEEQLHTKLEQKQITPIEHDLDELLARKQIEQRTPAWYEQMSTVISASEIGNLFASPRQRAKMVISKTIPYLSRNQPLATVSSRMSAFDWGIRFEPVVKQIYELKYGATIKELGRLYHPTDKRCAASPDGLIVDSIDKKGRLIEIKCPVTRIINDTIPKDYYSQMQLQLHVTGLTICDYVEAVFSSKYNMMPEKEGDALYSGFIAVVMKDQELYYIYSPITTDPWVPETEDEVVEIVPWKLVQWGEHVVKRSDEWWASIVPMMDTFWEDVEKAKRGEFVVPESTRKRKNECKIIFNKVDEQGN